MTDIFVSRYPHSSNSLYASPTRRAVITARKLTGRVIQFPHKKSLFLTYTVLVNPQSSSPSIYLLHPPTRSLAHSATRLFVPNTLSHLPVVNFLARWTSAGYRHHHCCHNSHDWTLFTTNTINSTAVVIIFALLVSVQPKHPKA